MMAMTRIGDRLARLLKESDVADLFMELNIREYPIDPMQIALDLGYDLVPFTQMPKEVKRELIFKDIDGISHYDPERKKFVIYYRPDGMKERLRFTIGHEIGHLRMKHRHESELARRIADYYAAYLLAPTPWIAHVEGKQNLLHQNYMKNIENISKEYNYAG